MIISIIPKLNGYFQSNARAMKGKKEVISRFFEKSNAKALDVPKCPVIFTARPKEGGSDKPATVKEIEIF